MKDYLCKIYEDNKDKKYIFKVVEKDDKVLQTIKEAFNNVEVKVLSGNSTRSLHQIKPGGKKGYLLTRRFSCFCNYCLANDFENCKNKSITGGQFTERQLISDSGMNEDNFF